MHAGSAIQLKGHAPRLLTGKKLTLRRGDIQVRTRGGLTAVVWKGKRKVYMLTNQEQMEVTVMKRKMP
jgi:hypothetical protein